METACAQKHRWHTQLWQEAGEPQQQDSRQCSCALCHAHGQLGPQHTCQTYMCPQRTHCVAPAWHAGISNMNATQGSHSNNMLAPTTHPLPLPPHRSAAHTWCAGLQHKPVMVGNTLSGIAGCATRWKPPAYGCETHSAVAPAAVASTAPRLPADCSKQHVMHGHALDSPAGQPAQPLLARCSMRPGSLFVSTAAPNRCLPALLNCIITSPGTNASAAHFLASLQSGCSQLVDMQHQHRLLAAVGAVAAAGSTREHKGSGQT